MTTYTIAGTFGWAGGGKAGAIVDIWATSRFTGPPAENQAPPSGDPDAGPVTTGPTFGSPGAFYITGITVLQDYYIRVQYGEQTFWGTRTASTLGGVGGGGDVLTVFGRTGNITAQTGDYTYSQVGADQAGAAATAQTNAENYTNGAVVNAIVTAENYTNVAIVGLAAIYAPLASPALTGSPTAPTKSPLTNNTDIATTAYTDLAVGVEKTRAEGAEALLAPLASPALTGVPTAPTAAPSTSTTQIATTAFVEAAIPTATLGTLGYAQITASQTGIVSLTAITGLSVTVTVGSGRRIKISAYCPNFAGGTMTDFYAIFIYEGASVLQGAGVFGGTGGFGTACLSEVILTPTTGSHTYFVQANHQTGSSAGSFGASTGNPAFILVEDIGT